MAQFCTRCGTEIPENGSFCPDCGARQEAVSAETARPAEAIQTQTYAKQSYQQYQQSQNYYAKQNSVSADGNTAPVVSTAAFIGYMLLFALPLAGFIICIVMAFSASNENIKHYARAILIIELIAVALIVLIALIAVAVGVSVFSAGYSHYNYGNYYSILNMLI